MVFIEFSSYCGAIYPKCGQIKSQGMFVSKLFVAGGSTYFSVTTTSDKDYQRKLYSGSKPLTKSMRDSFSRVVNTDDVAAFFDEYIKFDQLREVMTSFAIPISAVPDKKLLSRALSAQFQSFIQSDANNVDDIVAMEYQRLLSEPVELSTQSVRPLYPNDSAYVEEFQPRQVYSVTTYERFQHTWIIKNTGTQTWRGRKLVFENYANVRPRTNTNMIDITDTPPGKAIKITTGIDARGFEGCFDCLWEMHDSDGNNCFPDNKKLFSVTIAVIYKPE